MSENEEYFMEVVSQLSATEVRILSFLYNNDAVDALTPIKTANIREQLNLAKSSFNQTISRLILTSMIKSVNNSRNFSVYLTAYGCTALHLKTNGGMTL
ncbi:helix-turn-helix domain-containing protein [Priestia megaterium]